jgi:ABC-type transport system involved in multi-copper enzyme maturation permease subunit
MHWIFLLFALLFLAMAMKSTAPGWLVVLLVLASLVLMIAWILGWIASRISRGARDDTSMISPEEMRQLREQAEARRNAAKPEDPQT